MTTSWTCYVGITGAGSRGVGSSWLAQGPGFLQQGECTFVRFKLDSPCFCFPQKCKRENTSWLGLRLQQTRHSMKSNANNINFTKENISIRINHHRPSLKMCAKNVRVQKFYSSIQTLCMHSNQRRLLTFQRGRFHKSLLINTLFGLTTKTMGIES